LFRIAQANVVPNIKITFLSVRGKLRKANKKEHPEYCDIIFLLPALKDDAIIYVFVFYFYHLQGTMFV
jgi:hypothetical protein